ncbi:MAG: c-type cytochrome [Candidatus Nitrospinota bacterium M3_3B_026]
MITRSHIRLPLALAFALLFIAAHGAGSAGEDAAAIYKKHCAVCHGEKGDGKTRAVTGMSPRPTDFTDPAATAGLTDERMIKSVREGVEKTAMAGFSGRLTEEQIAAVTGYVRESFMATPARSRGAELYATNCAVCHGENGDGRSRAAGGLMKKPRNFRSGGAKKELTRDRMIFSATYGVPNSPMVGFEGRLTEEEIETVVDYVRETFMGLGEGEAGQAHEAAGKAVNGADMSLPFPGGLVGDARAGAKFYKNSCYKCHGWFGDGNGPRSKFIYPKPRDFGHPASRRKYNRPALFEAIARGVTGAEMPAWDKVLTEQQIADVAEYVFQTFIKKQ